MQKRFSNFAMLAMIALLSFTLITGISVGAQPKWGGTLVIALNDEIGAANPALVSSTTKGHVTGQIFSTLTVDGLDNVTGEWFPTPSLAESWEVSSDSLTVTYHLVHNATWHDGVPFTSADVVFSFMDVIKKYHPAATVTWRKVQLVEAPDNYTVVFHMSEPDPDFLINHSTAYGAIIPKHKYTHLNGTVWSGPEIKSVAGDPAFAIGTGPFMMEEWVKGDHITLVRNPNYFRAPLPYLDKIVYKVIPDPSMRVLSMEAGEIDFYPFEVTSTDVAKLNSTTIAVTDQGADYAGSQLVVHINLRNPILSNPLVRHAMSAGMNRQLMSDLASDGAYKPSAGVISTAWKYWDTPSVQEEPYNVTYANQLLDQAGYPRGTDGTRFTVRFQFCNTDTTEGNKCAEILRDEMAALGIQVDLMPLDENTFMEKTYWNGWDFDLAMWSGFGTIMGWYQLYYSGNIREGNYLNCMGYNNSIVDVALDRAFSVVDKVERKAAFSTFETEVAKDLPTFNLIENPHYSAYKVTFQGIPWGHWGFRDPANEVWWTLATGTGPGTTEPQSSAGFPLLEVSVAVVAIAVILVAGFGFYRRSKKK